MNSKKLTKKYYSDFENLKSSLANLKERLVKEKRIEDAAKCRSIEKDLNKVLELSKSSI